MALESEVMTAFNLRLNAIKTEIIFSHWKNGEEMFINSPLLGEVFLF